MVPSSTQRLLHSGAGDDGGVEKKVVGSGLGRKLVDSGFIWEAE